MKGWIIAEPRAYNYGWDIRQVKALAYMHMHSFWLKSSILFMNGRTTLVYSLPHLGTVRSLPYNVEIFVMGSRKRYNFAKQKILQYRLRSIYRSKNWISIFYYIIICIYSFTSQQSMKAEFSWKIVQIASYIKLGNWIQTGSESLKTRFLN